ncbi:MAG: competence protein ComFB [Spirochaetaceae bacterium]|nr:MAG: competence protein ComFB [Spirochaetaceae bacterium]
MESTVMRVVDQICEEDTASADPKYLTTEECRLDVACYVLNRIPQRYVSSARGQAHTEQDLGEDQQLFVDIVTLTHEGLRRVSSVRRPFYGDEIAERAYGGPRYYLPTITGRLLNGLTFDLISGIDVSLLADDCPMDMIDLRWQNPYTIDPGTAGTYLFWPLPVVADRDDDHRTFELEIRVTSDAYEEFHHFVTVEVTSTSDSSSLISSVGELRVPDLYLLPK